MKYREQLEHELKQTESQLKKLEEAEKSKMRERNQLNKEVLKILMKKTESRNGLEEKTGNTKEFSKYDNIIQVTITIC